MKRDQVIGQYSGLTTSGPTPPMQLHKPGEQTVERRLVRAVDRYRPPVAHGSAVLIANLLWQPRRRHLFQRCRTRHKPQHWSHVLEHTRSDPPAGRRRVTPQSGVDWHTLQLEYVEAVAPPLQDGPHSGH